MLEPSLFPPLPEFWLLTWAPPSIPRTQSKFHPLNQKPVGGGGESGLPEDGHLVPSYRKQPMMGFGWMGLGHPLPKPQKAYTASRCPFFGARSSAL